MTDFLSALGNDLAVFSDLGTDPPRVMSNNDRVVVRMTRGGDELRLEFLDRGNGKVVEHSPNAARPRSHASYKALLASETFSDVGHHEEVTNSRRSSTDLVDDDAWRVVVMGGVGCGEDVCVAAG